MSFKALFLGRFFPKAVRDDVFKLYSFAQTVKDFTEIKPSNIEKFEHIEHRWKTVKGQLAKKQVPTPLDGSKSERVLANIAYLTHRHSFDPAWVDAFLKSMRWDIQKHEYRSLKDLHEYMYGSSEVLALMLARILGLPEESQKAVRMQGRAMQYMAFLRGLSAQEKRGFRYFPLNDLKKYGLKDLTEAEARKKPRMFADFIHAELLRYAQWQAEANEGLMLIPKRLKGPFLTLIDTDNWTAQQLKYDPMKAFDKRLKPHRHQVVRQVMRHTMSK